MRFFSPPALLAAALLSVVATIPFLPLAREEAGSFALEARLSTSAPGYVQVYYDLGAGLSEAASSRFGIPEAGDMRTYRLPLPAGLYRSLRFDPLDREGRIALESLRIVATTGRVVRSIALSQLQPLWQIETAQQQDGRLSIATTPQAADPQLLVTFSPPLELRPTWRERIAGLPSRALLLFVPLALVLLAMDRLPAVRRRCIAARDTLCARPARAVAIVAAAAAIGSMYPVVFLGKSYVSPNLGTVLLYEMMPTLPGYTDTETVDVKGADIGAVMWWHLPLSVIEHRAMFRDGELPLWNRYNSGGTPLLGQGQSMFGDPLHLFVIATKGAAWAWDLKYLIAKWLFAFGLGLIVLRLVVPESPDSGVSSGDKPRLGPSLLVAAAAPFVGFFLYRFNHPAFFSVCYAPWPLYCWLRVAQSPALGRASAWAGGLIVANLALMNSGTAKEAYMLLLTMNFSGACVLLATEAPWTRRLARFTLVGWAGALFALISAPFWATFLQALGQAHTAYNAPSAFQIQPAVILGAFDEIFYRPLMPADMTFNPSVNFVIALGLLYFLATLSSHFSRPAVLALAASSLLPLALAFGLIPPAWIVRVPFLGNVAHIDNTFSCGLVILWCALAGVGFGQAARRLGRPEGRGDVLAVCLMLFAVVFAWIAFRQVVHRPIHGPTFTVNQSGHPLPVSPFVWGYLWTLLGASLLALAVFRRALRQGGFTPALVLLGALCFLVLTWRHSLHTTDIGFIDYTARTTVRTDFHARSEAVEFVRATQTAEPSRGYGLRGNFFPGWTGVYGLETIHAADPLVNPHFREFTGAMPGIERIWDWRLYMEPATAAVAQPYLDAFNVRYYFASKGDADVLRKTLDLAKAADLDVYISPTAWPRAFFTDRVQVYENVADFMRLVGEGDRRPFAAVQQSDSPALQALTALPRGPGGRIVQPANGYKLTENSTAFRVEANGPGVIVLTEVFAAGDFQATVNGRPAPILRVNHAFKGIVVDAAGSYEVAVRYRPRHFNRNLLLSAIGFLLLAGSAAVLRVLARRRANESTANPAKLDPVMAS